MIPNGYEVVDKKQYWKTTENGLETELELAVGEEKDLSIKLKWLNNENNIGIKDNIVQIIDTENPANYEEITTNDNISTAGVIVGITTGPQFETLFKVELAMSVVVILLLILNIGEVSIIRKKK